MDSRDSVSLAGSARAAAGVIATLASRVSNRADRLIGSILLGLLKFTTSFPGELA
jgi:hypothetical protein